MRVRDLVDLQNGVSSYVRCPVSNITLYRSTWQIGYIDCDRGYLDTRCFIIYNNNYLYHGDTIGVYTSHLT